MGERFLPEHDLVLHQEVIQGLESLDIEVGIHPAVLVKYHVPEKARRCDRVNTKSSMLPACQGRASMGYRMVSACEIFLRFTYPGSPSTRPS